jgi:predicted nucleic acid-binding protein
MKPRELQRPVRVYADTSVFGGVFDAEFAEATAEFFQEVKFGRFVLVTSAVVQDEIAAAPAKIREFFAAQLATAEIGDISTDALLLQQAYLAAGILTPNWAADALHVALASAHNCALIVSWNFQHIVHFRKIPLYNAVNKVRGYAEIGIYSPREVIAYENENL